MGHFVNKLNKIRCLLPPHHVRRTAEKRILLETPVYMVPFKIIEEVLMFT